MSTKNISFSLAPKDNKRLAKLCGEQDKNLHKIAEFFKVEINNRGCDFNIAGDRTFSLQAKETISILYAEIKNNKILTAKDIDMVMQAVVKKSRNHKDSARLLSTSQMLVKPRTPNQERYLENIVRFDVNFGIGPAGTGKTYLAVAYAVYALENGQVNRIIVTRPIVEAGEHLGYLPGDIAQKVDPYLRPIYDALYDTLGASRVNRLISDHTIEIAPLAFMRGRTLNDAIIILDEAQNTTIEQMKMFLTRIGFNSKAIITGDITQIDLPKNQSLGLNHAIEILKDEKDIGFCFFQNEDIVRHRLVQRIVEAYERAG